MSDFSGLNQNDSLQRFYDRHSSRLPTEPIPDKIGKSEDDKALNTLHSTTKTKRTTA